MYQKLIDQIMADVMAETRPMPESWEELKAELPAIEWPE